ncbi:MAG: flavin reductase family protein [Alphaproteobacteria bacterium]|nr:flavin reductase family protein [Alphaproteobacteria bacterium]
MYIDDPRQHGLRFNPWKAIVVPRPIGWISTLSREGVANLAPFSYFNGVADFPPMVMFAPIGPKPEGGAKDSYANAVQTQEFVVNMVTWELRERMNLTSEHFAADVDEFERAGLTKVPCVKVKAPRVAESPVALECRLVTALRLPTDAPPIENNIVIGEVIGIHLDERILADGVVDIARYRPMARLGYFDYACVSSSVTIPRPDLNPTEVAAELSELMPGARASG